MARRDMRQWNRQYVSGSLAYDYVGIEREERRRREREERAAAQRAGAGAPPRARRRSDAVRRHRERIRVSPVAVLGFSVIAVMAVMLLMNYAQLTSISNQVVEQQKRLSSLEEEHVKLVSRYERTFDLAAIKEAAENAGMAKPSSSQIYYIDLSAPDNVVLYQHEEEHIFGRVAAAACRNLQSIVEYLN
jgi:cell division protein FtsB